MTKYVWFDLETTGLDPATDRLLEIGALMCDENMEVLDVFHLIPWFPYIDHWTLDPVVYEMHSDNGLLEECANSRTVGEEYAWVRFVEWLNVWRTGREDLVPCGSGILHFDLPYMKVNAPKAAAEFTYYGFDVGVLRRTMKWADDWMPPYEEKEKAHRALADARDHHSEFMYITDYYAGR